MKSLVIIGIAVLSLSASATYAQNAKPTYEGAPETYKVIFENENFRVIEANWKAGSTDKPHTHPVPSVIYNVTGCTLKLRNADGKIVEANSKPDTANAVPIVAQPHTAENVGTTDCKAIIVERK